VYGKLGAGLLQEFYQDTLTDELTQNHSHAAQRYPIALCYDTAVVRDGGVPACCSMSR
jgi:hypothetical protein